MIPHPFDRYELAKAHHEQLQQAGEMNRRAMEATTERPQRIAHALACLGSLPGALTLWLKALGKAVSALAGSRASSPQQATTHNCQRTAASALNHTCAQPGDARHPHAGTQAGHSACYSCCVPGHVG